MEVETFHDIRRRIMKYDGGGRGRREGHSNAFSNCTSLFELCLYYAALSHPGREFNIRFSFIYVFLKFLDIDHTRHKQ